MNSLTTITTFLLTLSAATAMGVSVRVVELSPPVDTLVREDVAFTNLEFGAFTSCADLQAGDYDFQVVTAGTTGPAVIDTTVTLIDNDDFTIAATGTLSGITAAIHEKKKIRLPASTGIQLIHLSPDTPAVDILALRDCFGSNDPWANIDSNGIVDVDDAMALLMNDGHCN